jgi:hypothetical protein
VGTDIVEASARAYLSAVNKCLATMGEGVKPPQVPAVAPRAQKALLGAQP